MTDNATTETTNQHEPPATTSMVRDVGTPGFARRHPALTVIGAASLGLIGGVELAAGVLIGAGVAALLKLQDGRAAATRAHEVESRAHKIADRMPQDLRQRARAIMQAARGQLHPRAGEQAPDPTMRH